MGERVDVDHEAPASVRNATFPKVIFLKWYVIFFPLTSLVQFYAVCVCVCVCEGRIQLAEGQWKV